MYSKLHITIFESSNEVGGYDVAYNYDAMPIHATNGPFPSLGEAKASVPYDVSWSDPDEDASRDVVVVSSVTA
jgi:hypothetical protein